MPTRGQSASGYEAAEKGTEKQSMVNGPWPMVHAEQLMVNG